MSRDPKTYDKLSTERPLEQETSPRAYVAGSLSANEAPTVTLRRLRDEAEIHAISVALEKTRWNRKRAAELLRISYRGLLYKIRQHNITSTTVSRLASLLGTTSANGGEETNTASGITNESGLSSGFAENTSKLR